MGDGPGFPNKVSAIGGHFMFDDDQQTPNDLNCAFEFDLPNGQRRMITFEVRHWMTNHEAEIGTPSLGTPEPKKSTVTEKLGPWQAATIQSETYSTDQRDILPRAMKTRIPMLSGWVATRKNRPLRMAARSWLTLRISSIA